MCILKKAALYRVILSDVIQSSMRPTHGARAWALWPLVSELDVPLRPSSLYSHVYREGGAAGGKEGGRRQPAAGQELEQAAFWARAAHALQPPGLGPPGRHHGYFHGAGSPVSLVCIRVNNHLSGAGEQGGVSGRTLTIFNDWGRGHFVGWRKAGRN